MPSSEPRPKKIIHIDMDAFFASVEQRDNPNLKGKPVVVGGNPDGRGVVAAASYEARAFGIRSAMSCYEAKKRCPDTIFIFPRFDAYRAASQEIHQIFTQYTDLIEPLSLDEAYLDVTDCTLHKGSATLIANSIRQEIFDKLHLTASAGVSINKMLAKIASDINKPNGIAVITPDMAQDFVDNLPIEKFFGIGKATTQHMHRLGLYLGRDLKHADLAFLTQEFGKRGEFYYNIAHLRDDRAVTPARLRKSVGHETTFLTNTKDKDELIRAISEQNSTAYTLLTTKNLQATTVTLKVKYANFTQITRSHSTKSPIKNAAQSLAILGKLLDSVPLALSVRLVGVTFSNLSPKTGYTQLELF